MIVDKELLINGWAQSYAVYSPNPLHPSYKSDVCIMFLLNNKMCEAYGFDGSGHLYEFDINMNTKKHQTYKLFPSGKKQYVINRNPYRCICYREDGSLLNTSLRCEF